jgi:hypothetical protein
MPPSLSELSTDSTTSNYMTDELWDWQQYLWNVLEGEQSQMVVPCWLIRCEVACHQPQQQRSIMWLCGGSIARGRTTDCVSGWYKHKLLCQYTIPHYLQWAKMLQSADEGPNNWEQSSSCKWESASNIWNTTRRS